MAKKMHNTAAPVKDKGLFAPIGFHNSRKKNSRGQQQRKAIADYT